MKVLIIGGTQFLGRHFVECGQKLGHELTLFNRGVTGPDLYPEPEHLKGDRDSELDLFRGRTWDAVIDTCGYLPRVVRKSAERLRDSVDTYVFISSLSVYQDHTPHSDESAPVLKLEDLHSEDVPMHYGALKASCEVVVEECFPSRALHVRAGMIIGPYDKMDRMNYWLTRMQSGGEVIVPEAHSPLQWVDARDIADWVYHCLTNGTGGTFNVTGPEAPLDLNRVLHQMNNVLGNPATLIEASDEFLIAKDIKPIDGLPYWIPPDLYGFFHRDVRKAIDSGLKFRPLRLTIHETWEELSRRTVHHPSTTTKLAAARELARAMGLQQP